MSLLSIATTPTPPPPPSGGSGLVSAPPFFPHGPKAYSYDLTVPAGSSDAAFVSAMDARKGFGTPRLYRSRIELEAGSHTYALSGNGPVDIVGATTNPADTVVAITGGSRGVLNTWGGPSFYGGLTLDCVDDPAGILVYPCHHGAAGLTIFESVHFLHHNPGGYAIGMDGHAGSITWLINCTLTGGGMNIHGATTNAQPLRVVWLDCAPVGFDTVGYSDLGSGQPDEIWVLYSSGYTGPRFQHYNGGGANVRWFSSEALTPGNDPQGTFTQVTPAQWPRLPEDGWV